MRFAPYSVRLKMLQKAFKSINDVKVSDVENKLPKPGYTIQTVQYLTSNYTGYSFYLCIGYDSFINFRNWYKWKEILKLCPLLVVNRPSHSQDSMPDDRLLSRSTIIDHQPVEASSSKIRDKIAHGKTIKGLVPSAAIKIIDDENLYQ